MTPSDPILSLKPFLDPTKKFPVRLCENFKFWSNFDLKMATKHLKIGIFEKLKKSRKQLSVVTIEHHKLINKNAHAF